MEREGTAVDAEDKEQEPLPDPVLVFYNHVPNTPMHLVSCLQGLLVCWRSFGRVDRPTLVESLSTMKAPTKAHLRL